MKTLDENFASGGGYLIFGRKLPLQKSETTKITVISSREKVLGCE